MTQILDYSWARPSPQACKDYPAVGVMRYLGPGNGGRDITKAEMDSLQAVGLGVGLVWETTANRALEGYPAGTYDAGQAARYADALAFDRPVYFACDCDVSTSQAYGQVLEYFRGTTVGPYEARAYGEADVLDATAENLGFRHGWQPASTSWSNNRVSGHAGMLQKWPYVMNDQCDDNDVLCPDDQIDWLCGYQGEDEVTDDDINRILSGVGVIIDNRIAQFMTASLLWEDNDEFFEVTVDGDGQRVRRQLRSGELLVLRGGALMAEQPAIDVSALESPQRDAFRAWRVV